MKKVIIIVYGLILQTWKMGPSFILRDYVRAATVSDDLPYTVSMTGADKVATATVSVAIPVEPEVKLAGGWFVISKTYQDGVVDINDLILNNYDSKK